MRNLLDNKDNEIEIIGRDITLEDCLSAVIKRFSDGSFGDFRQFSYFSEYNELEFVKYLFY